MTPDQLDRLQLAILNMVLLDDGEDPITLAQLQAENAADPTEAAEQRAKVAKLVAAVLQAAGFGELYEAAAKGFHLSETCGPEGKFNRIIKFQTLPDLHAFEGAWRAAMTAVRDAG